MVQQSRLLAHLIVVGTVLTLFGGLITPAAEAADLSAPSFTGSTAYTTSIYVKWSTVTGASTYNLQYKKSSTSSWSNALIGTTVKEYTIGSLSVGTSYDIQVQAIGPYVVGVGTKTSAWTKKTISTLKGDQSQPAAPTIYSVTTTTVVLDSVSGCEYAMSSSGPWQSSTTFSGLSAGTSYSFYQRKASTTSYNASPASAGKIQTTQLAVPTASMGAPTQTSIPITINAVKAATHYQARWTVNGTSNWTEGSASTATTLSVFPLTAGTKYDFQIRALYVGVGGPPNSNWSGTYVSTTSSPTPLSTPSVTVTASTVSSISVTWPAINNAGSYNVDYKKSNDSTWTTYVTGTTARTQTILGLSSGTSYNIRVQAVPSYPPGDPWIVSAWGSVTATTATPQQLSAPIVTEAGKTTTSITIAWTEANYAATYNVEYKKNTDSTWLSVETGYSGLSKTVIGLTSGTTYNFRVQAVPVYTPGTPWTSSEWRSVSATTNSVMPLSKPQEVNLVGNTTSSIRITWSRVDNAATYNVEYRKHSDSAWTSHLSGTSDMTTNIVGLMAATAYEIRVQAVPYYSIGGPWTLSDWTSVIYSTNGVMRLDTPKVSLTDMSANSVLISWVAVDNASRYNVEYKKSSSSEWTVAGVSISGLSIEVKQLVFGTSYDYRVQAFPVFSIGGQWTVSEWGYLNGVKKGMTLLDTPVVSAESITVNSIGVSWSDVNLAATYNVEYKKYSASEWEPFAVGTKSREYVVGGLQAWSTYMFRVQAIPQYSPSTPFLPSDWGYATGITEIGTRRAVLIANQYIRSEDEPCYEIDSEGNELCKGLVLPDTKNDLINMKALLSKTQNDMKWNAFGLDRIITHLDANRKQIIDAIRAAAVVAGENDLLFFYYAGHGRTADGHTYIVPTDYDRYPTNEDLISEDELANELKKVPGHIVVILDSCFSGGFIDALKGPKFHVLTATSKDDLTPGGFTKHLIESSGYELRYTGELFGEPNEPVTTLDKAYSYIHGKTPGVQAYPRGDSFPLFLFPSLTTSTKSWSLPSVTTSTSVDLRTYTSWTVLSDLPSWLTVSPTSGTGDATLTLSVSTNEDNAERFGTITIEAGTQTTTINVSQAGLVAQPEIIDPVIVGNPMVGQTLSVEAAVLPPSATLAYEWYRGCELGTTIPGATADTYIVQTVDAGQLICAKVTATNPYSDSASKFSNAVMIQVPIQVQNTKLPASAVVGQTITVDLVYTPTDATYIVEWYRNGTNLIAGANWLTYTIQPADSGGSLVAKITVLKHGYGSVTVFTNVMAVQGNPPPYCNAYMTPVGPVTHNQAITLVADVSPADAFVLIEWYVSGSMVMMSTNPLGGNYYTPTATDSGKTIVAKLTVYVPSFAPLILFSNAVDVV